MDLRLARSSDGGKGDTVTISVTNRLKHDTSIHWHGIRVPADMDGVPGLSFAGTVATWPVG